MGAKEKNLRKGLVKKVGRGYVLTDLGLCCVRESAALGMSQRASARYLGVSEKVFREWLDEEGDNFYPEVLEFWADGKNELEKRILEAQLTLMETNGAVAIHMGKQYADQKEEERTINHNIQVVGTLPDFSVTPEQWRRQFAPTALQQLGDESAEDVEFEEVKNAPREQSEGGD